MSDIGTEIAGTAEQGESPHKGKTGLRRVWNAFFYSVDGFGAALKHEDAFRQESLLALMLIPAALYFGDSGLERALLVASIVLVLIVELINSAIEATVDRISLENHKLAKRAKDIGSASVLLSLINVFAVWGLVLFG
ncbi:MAG: diacylglycerol kinase [Hydrogenophilales bacterium]|nr:diacylglycerol kinase [Hydrogenophilales bacterium]